MERLTEKTKDCFGYRLKDGSDAEVGFFKDYDAFFSHNMVVKALGEYEDLEEQGLLLRLPCKAGDTVYIPLINRIMEKQVISIIVQRSFIMVYCGNNSYPFSREDFGKTVFLTEEEAEAKLREMEVVK